MGKIVEHLIPRGRPRLAAVLQQAGSFVAINDVVAVLGMSRSEAAKTLARWTKQGWLKRLKRGVYIPIPMNVQGTGQILEDPWVLIPKMFGDSYVAGWSAAEHWGLTEQIFRSICICTTKPVKKTEINIQETPFVLKHIPTNKLFGTQSVWRGATKVQVSTPERTIIDMIDDPRIGGGIIHVIECLNNLFTGELGKWEGLFDMAEKLGNGAVFKRLGFIMEKNLPKYSQLIDLCRSRLSTGLAKLDPALPCQQVVKSWNLRIPTSWQNETLNDRK